MREVEFRGWSENAEWVYGSLLGTDKIIGDVVEWNSEYFCTEFWYLVDIKSIGQYTGLADKTGNKIYEGDILKVPDWYDLPENTYMTYNNQLVTFKNHCFCVDGDSMFEDSEYISDECEVIGNIYENPELLKGEVKSM